MCTLRKLGLLVALAAGCAPMTFSQEASVNFAAYPSLSFELGGPDGSARQGAYLQSELREHSGFRSVTQLTVEAFEPATAQLTVELSVQSSGYDGVNLLVAILGTGDEEDEAITYSASVSYRLSARDGRVIDSGGESVQNEITFNDAAQAALDEVVLHYLRPYRL